MKLSRLIRELSVVRDKLKVDPEVSVYTYLRTEEFVKSVYVGELKVVSYIKNPDNIILICE